LRLATEPNGSDDDADRTWCDPTEKELWNHYMGAIFEAASSVAQPFRFIPRRPPTASASAFDRSTVRPFLKGFSESAYAFKNDPMGEERTRKWHERQ